MRAVRGVGVAEASVECQRIAKVFASTEGAYVEQELIETGGGIEALAVLKGAGYANSVHVGGGVSAWVNQIDPSQPSY